MSEYTDGVFMSNLEVSSSRKGVRAGPETAGAEMTEEGVVLRLRDLRPSRALPPLLLAPAYGGMLAVGCVELYRAYRPLLLSLGHRGGRDVLGDAFERWTRSRVIHQLTE